MSWHGKDELKINRVEALVDLTADIAACADTLEVAAHGGLVLRSPDGSKWKIKVDNTGAITTEKIV